MTIIIQRNQCKRQILFRKFKLCNGCTPSASAGRGIRERFDVDCAGENLTDHFPLCADAAAVNNADMAESASVCFLKIRLHGALLIARPEAVQIENVCDCNFDGKIVTGFVCHSWLDELPW